MRENIQAYITALVNVMERRNDMISTGEVVDNLVDLLDFVMDLPDDQIIEIQYDGDGSDGMDELNRFYPLN